MKEFLSRHRVPFTTRMLTDEANRLEAARYGPGSAPLTLIGGEAIRGFDRALLLAGLGRAGLLTEPVRAAAPAGPHRFRPRAPMAEAIAIASFLGDSVTFLHARTGRYLGVTLESSSVPVAGRPIAIESCASWGTLAVVNYQGGGVTFLSARDGAYLAGDLDASTRATGQLPLYAVAHHEEPLLYVSNSESCSVTVLDPRSGAYAFGSREGSTFALPGQPGVMALHRRADVLYVRLREGAVAMLEARTMRPLRGTLKASTFAVGKGRGIALSADERILYVPEALEGRDGLALFDARTGEPLFGSREASTLPTAPTPFAVAAHPSKPIVYVSCFGTQVVELRDGETGRYLSGDRERSSVRVGSGARALLADGQRDALYVTSFDESSVSMLDAATGAPRFGALEASRLATGRGPRGMALVSPSG